MKPDLFFLNKKLLQDLEMRRLNLKSLSLLSLIEALLKTPGKEEIIRNK